MTTDRWLITTTYNKHLVLERECVSTYHGHTLNQLQDKCLAVHAGRLNAIVGKGWGWYRICYTNGKEERALLKRGVFPAIIKPFGREIDLYAVYTILPLIRGRNHAPNRFPYLPIGWEFLYLQDLTDFRTILARKRGL